MYGVSEIRKINQQKQSDFESARDGTFAVLQDGDVLIRSIRSSKVLSGEAAATFIEDIRGKTPNYIKVKVQGYFARKTQLA